MKKILFVCHGNICRSPMAEFVMKDLVRQAGLAGQFQIASAATSTEELGNPVYPPARRKLWEHGIRCEGKRARQRGNQHQAAACRPDAGAEHQPPSLPGKPEDPAGCREQKEVDKQVQGQKHVKINDRHAVRPSVKTQSLFPMCSDIYYYSGE